MQIIIYAGGMPFNGDTIAKGESLGGSETAAYYMAKELAALGHDVICFTSSQETGKFDGVIYEWHGELSQQAPLGDRFSYVAQTPHDVLIIQRHPSAFLQRFNSKINLWWLHDLALHRNSQTVIPSLVNIDRIICVSEFHKDQVAEVHALSEDNILASFNGVDYSMFEGLDEIKKEKGALLYAARPERGLENLVGKDGIMELLTDCHLYVCGYDNTTAQMKSYYEYLWGRCAELPNVTYLGNLGKRELYERMASCELYVYPTTFEDTSCILAMEAAAAGLPMIGSNWSAVPETMENAGATLLELEDGQVNKKKFAKTVKKLLSIPNKLEQLAKQASGKRQDWGTAAIQWLNEIKSIFAEAGKDDLRMAKHFEHTSDIFALGEMCRSKQTILKYLPDYEVNYSFVITGDFAGHYERYYQYEKDRGVDYGPEDLSGNPRYEIIKDEITKLTSTETVGEIKALKIMDYGCAHGHYTINLAKQFPACFFVGVDINESNIETARKWAASEKIMNIEFFCTTHDKLDKEVLREFDLIIAAEVLEHVPNPADVVDTLQQFVVEGGTFMISTPYGPWEALGYKEHPGWRAHIHHFERSDLKDLWGHNDMFRLLALPHRDDLGHYLVMFEPNDMPTDVIDYERKFATQMPAQTLSVCMIAKDEADSIGRTLKRVSEIADEIIVGIDEDTTDETEAVCEKYGAKIINIVSPLDQGFDGARNYTIAEAQMDWILWIDADETLENPTLLKKYLRNNSFNGYGIAQHHFSAEPAALFKTDYPIRLFRNRKDIRFFGYVHEHPSVSTDMNEGVGKIVVLPDVSIMHTGYSTETIRRNRFKRNWPLIQKDKEKYPERDLGKFLWMRDLAHLAQYTMEQNGGVVTPEVHQYATEIIDIWREILKNGNSRNAREGLQYYSSAVAIVSGGNYIDFGIDLAASKGNGGVDMGKDVVQGKFAAQEDINVLVTKIIEEQTGVFNEKYW